MFGLLNKQEIDSLDQRDYSATRGRFYFFWNVSKTAGQPVLIALMAGDAAHSVETIDNQILVEEATARLAKMFAPKVVPRPAEVIVTRWGRDPFAQGTYSFVGPATQSGDYDVMARPHGPIHFAGEATCGTHPATVHGAYLSGLRAAAEIVESLLGPIQVQQSPLVLQKVKIETTAPKTTPKRPSFVHVWEPLDKPDMFTPVILEPKKNLESEILDSIVAEIGEKPLLPTKQKLNPYILYTTDNWKRCQTELDEEQFEKTGIESKVSRHEIRAALGAEWRNAPQHVKQPYLDKCKDGRENAAEVMARYQEELTAWETKAQHIREDILQNRQLNGAWKGPRTNKTGQDDVDMAH
jgi:hypothetical protein